LTTKVFVTNIGYIRYKAIREVKDEQFEAKLQKRHEWVRKRTFEKS